MSWRGGACGEGGVAACGAFAPKLQVVVGQACRYPVEDQPLAANFSLNSS